MSKAEIAGIMFPTLVTLNIAATTAGSDAGEVCFFFQAEAGIRDLTVTGVQTCALPISALARLTDQPGGTGELRVLEHPHVRRLRQPRERRAHLVGAAIGLSFRLAAELHEQIGRASCRERV